MYFRDQRSEPIFTLFCVLLTCIQRIFKVSVDFLSQHLAQCISRLTVCELKKERGLFLFIPYASISRFSCLEPNLLDSRHDKVRFHRSKRKTPAALQKVNPLRLLGRARVDSCDPVDWWWPPRAAHLYQEFHAAWNETRTYAISSTEAAGLPLRIGPRCEVVEEEEEVVGKRGWQQRGREKERERGVTRVTAREVGEVTLVPVSLC
ncbi:hypothetical protein PUN28_004881 [Cardiocondyla obscurior]|uniref:Uncharacterized protein n=1 Tax=Cardiocondyla obscurior TaxID=286306 RepID=A0AAW2GCY2_9HYME